MNIRTIEINPQLRQGNEPSLSSRAVDKSYFKGKDLGGINTLNDILERNNTTAYLVGSCAQGQRQYNDIEFVVPPVGQLPEADIMQLYKESMKTMNRWCSFLASIDGPDCIGIRGELEKADLNLSFDFVNYR